MEKEVAKVLIAKHVKQVKWLNSRRTDSAPFQKGDLVWYKRPPNTGEKLDSRFAWSRAVIEREGERYYVIELKPQFFIKAPRSLLKPYYEDQAVEKTTE